MRLVNGKVKSTQKFKPFSKKKKKKRSPGISLQHKTKLAINFLKKKYLRPGAHERLCGDTPSHPCVARMWFLIDFHCLDVKPRTRVFVASDRGELLLIPTTACRGCVARTRAHERLWLTDGDVASSSESMHKLRTCGALQSGMALPIHMGDSVARHIQDTDTLNKLQCGATASRTQSRSCAPGLKI